MAERSAGSGADFGYIAAGLMAAVRSLRRPASRGGEDVDMRVTLRLRMRTARRGLRAWL